MNILFGMVSSLLQFNGIGWKVSILGEKVLLLEALKEISIDQIHQSTRLIDEILGASLFDIVPAYHSIALFSEEEAGELLTKLEVGRTDDVTDSRERKKIEIPICYESWPDLEKIAAYAGLSMGEVIDIHLSGTYRVQFIGFLPGFIYADGLNRRIACPRRSNPRTRVRAGSVGIGGYQTGIYSLDSPGGWNIVGRTPIVLFDRRRQPSLLMEAGVEFSFYRITKDEFESWEN